MPQIVVKRLKRMNSNRKAYTPKENRMIGQLGNSSNIIKVKDIPSPEKKYSKPEKFEIFAYCSKNYQDAFEFVVPSWSRLPTVDKITIYTDWNFTYDDDKVNIIPMFSKSSDWIVGTGRRLDVIKDYSERNKGKSKNVLFLDIDCYITRDVSEIFQYDFDIAISRLHSKESHANKTATAGLWFARLTPGYYNFIEDWFTIAKEFKELGIGIKKHLISYVQYSFTKVAKTQTDRYKVLPIDENVYNSEHTIDSKWYDKIKKHKPKILHFKGRRFRDQKLVENVLRSAGEQVS